MVLSDWVTGFWLGGRERSYHVHAIVACVALPGAQPFWIDGWPQLPVVGSAFVPVRIASSLARRQDQRTDAASAHHCTPIAVGPAEAWTRSYWTSEGGTERRDHRNPPSPPVMARTTM